MITTNIKTTKTEIIWLGNFWTLGEEVEYQHHSPCIADPKGESRQSDLVSAP